MRVGCCASMIAPHRDPLGIESIESMAAMGFDYIELSLAHMALCSEETFEALLLRVGRSGLRCEACNNFFPPHIRLTGPHADLDVALRYASVAMARAGKLGVDAIVLGSSGAKNLPEGFPVPEALVQLVELLRRLGPIAEDHGVTVAIEPISRPEANFINKIGEALTLVGQVDHPRIRLLVDYFHMAGESESPDLIRHAGALIHHAHFARPGDRLFPTEWEAPFDPFFRALGEIQYTGRLSIEAFTDDFEADGPRALEVMRKGTPGTEGSA